MSLTEARPDLHQVLADMGSAGRRISEIDASEAGAGNISVCLAGPVETTTLFPDVAPIELPVAVPALAGRTLLVTGSGRRLREIAEDPAANVGAVLVHPDGRTGTLSTSPRRRFARLTSEYNSHLAVHQDLVLRGGGAFSALVHAQPQHLTYLSQIPTYRGTPALNRRLIRWEPETIISLPEGIGVIDFMVPGSAELMAATVDGLRVHRIVLWSKHGVMARSAHSVMGAVDRIEYAETAARYEYLDLSAGGPAEGLTAEQLRQVAKAFGVESPWI